MSRGSPGVASHAMCLFSDSMTALCYGATTVRCEPVHTFTPAPSLPTLLICQLLPAAFQCGMADRVRIIVTKLSHRAAASRSASLMVGLRDISIGTTYCAAD